MSSPVDKGHWPPEYESDLHEIALREAVELLAPRLHELPDHLYATLRDALQDHERQMIDEPVLFSDTTLGKYFEEIQEDGTR